MTRRTCFPAAASALVAVVTALVAVVTTLSPSAFAQAENPRFTHENTDTARPSCKLITGEQVPPSRWVEDHSSRAREEPTSGDPQRPHPEAPHKELANRNDWQRPHWVMDVVGVHEGSQVADVGAGSGYFTLHLAGRVGWSGKVYAVDIREDLLAGIRVFRDALNLPQIVTVLGADDDPRLPANSLDAVLVVNTYHEMQAYDRMMGAILRALKPGGLLAIIDAEAKAGAPRAAYLEAHQLPAELVRADAVRNGFRYVRTESGFTNPDDGARWYFLIFERPTVPLPHP